MTGLAYMILGCGIHPRTEADDSGCNCAQKRRRQTTDHMSGMSYVKLEHRRQFRKACITNKPFANHISWAFLSADSFVVQQLWQYPTPECIYLGNCRGVRRPSRNPSSSRKDGRRQWLTTSADLTPLLSRSLFNMQEGAS